jgi:hypothetical protein
VLPIRTPDIDDSKNPKRWPPWAIRGAFSFSHLVVIILSSDHHKCANSTAGLQLNREFKGTNQGLGSQPSAHLNDTDRDRSTLFTSETNFTVKEFDIFTVADYTLSVDVFCPSPSVM